MTPRQFLNSYQYDDRLVMGNYFSSEPLSIKPGEKVGIVLLNLGGPEKKDDIAPFLYNLFMDPAIIDLPFGGVFRHWLSRFISSTRSRSVGKDYEVIGGGSPINRLTREQSVTLENFLNEHYGKPGGVEFRVYIAMRYWHPFSEETAEEMKLDGIDKVVLLPLYPQYSKTTTGSSLMYWWMLREKGEIPDWPTTMIFEYAANPRYIQAVSERIDEALQRFQKEERNSVHLLFSAHGTPLREMKERRDPYCCLIHATVDRLMAFREYDRPFHVAFQSKVGFAEWLTPSTPDKLNELSESGVESVLVVPIAFVTDHVETAYELDVEVRQEAEEFGIKNFEVTSGLNCHPLFITALAEATLAQLKLPGNVAEMVEETNGDGIASLVHPRPLRDLPHFNSEERRTRCHQCQYIAEALCWDVADRTAAQNPPSLGSKIER